MNDEIRIILYPDGEEDARQLLRSLGAFAFAIEVEGLDDPWDDEDEDEEDDDNE